MGEQTSGFKANENSITDIREFFAVDKALAPNEFIEFWRSLSEEEKNEFRHADLSTQNEG